MTYYKLLHIEFILCLIFVSFVVCKIEYDTRTVAEGTDVYIYLDLHRPQTPSKSTCWVFGPDGKEYIQFEADTRDVRYCEYFVMDIDISQNGKWSIIYDDKIKFYEINVIESSVKVSVNNTPLPTTENQLNSNTAKKNYFAKYYYYEGDKVDVVCMSLAVNNIVKKHKIKLKYSYAEALHNVFKNETFSSFTGAGFRTTLQAAHNNSFMLCKHAHVESYLTTYKIVYVTFLLHNAFNAKPITANVGNKKATGLTNIIKIQFGSSSNWNDMIPLQLNLPENKPFINMYTLGFKQIIYYEYEEDERFSANCSTLSATMHKYHYFIHFSNKVSNTIPFVTLNKRLSSADNNTIVQCFIRGIFQPLITRNISLVLRMSSPRKVMKIMPKASEKKEFYMWIIYLAAGVLVCFLICCSIIIYKMKKRNCYGQKKSTNGSNRDNRGSTLRKVNSSDYELHYSVPNNQTDNHSYYENINSDTKTDNTYAVLDLSNPDETSNKLDNDRTIYAEINHNVG